MKERTQKSVNQSVNLRGLFPPLTEVIVRDGRTYCVSFSSSRGGIQAGVYEEIGKFRALLEVALLDFGIAPDQGRLLERLASLIDGSDTSYVRVVEVGSSVPLCAKTKE